jgi:hypothetical protein
MLWGRSANRCAICRCELVMDPTETDDEAIIGDECHIVAQEREGPRGESSLDFEQRDKYNNLLLLCKVHHKLIDDQPNTYTVERLREIKAAHEKWVRESLQEFDSIKQRDDEIYSDYVEEWTRLINLNNWRTWSSYVLGGGQPTISVEFDAQLKSARDWILSRIWPRRYPELEASFENFRHVLIDFQNTFHQYSEDLWSDETMLATKKFYRIDRWDPVQYKKLYQQFCFHVDLVQDLMLELTRAANYICDHVRQILYPSYRLREGILLVESGPNYDLSVSVLRVEYQGAERTLRPYLGLEQFKRERIVRDVHFGRGESEEDPDFLANIG